MGGLELAGAGAMAEAAIGLKALPNSEVTPGDMSRT